MANLSPRPYVSAILAMSADGKISDVARSPARFPSQQDQQHLEARVAEVDATLFGAGTLRAYGTTLSVRDPSLLAQRQQQGLPSQPIQIVCSASGRLDPTWRFFNQPLPRWLLTTPQGKAHWYADPRAAARQADTSQANTRQTGSFERTLDWLTHRPNWPQMLTQLHGLGVQRLLLMGGGQLIAALAAAHCLDELWLTVCPLLIGGQAAPTPMDGRGFTLADAPRLKLLSTAVQGNEVFLHYRVRDWGL